jgi:hypothetical protein
VDLDAASGTVLRASWMATCSVVVEVAVVVVLLALLVGGDMQNAVIFVVAFSAASLLINRRRALELGSESAVLRGTLRGGSIYRTEVRSVRSGPWWRGGIVLVGPGRSLWAPVGDLPLGYVSAARQRVVRSWAAGTLDSDQEGNPKTDA